MIKKILRDTIAGVLLAALAIATWTWVHPAKGQYTALGPFETSTTASGTAVLAALPANPSRRGLTICNGHASQSLTVTFGPNITPVSLTTGIVIPGGNTTASCFSLLPNIIASPLVGVGAQVNTIASGAATPVTFLEF